MFISLLITNPWLLFSFSKSSNTFTLETAYTGILRYTFKTQLICQLDNNIIFISHFVLPLSRANTQSPPPYSLVTFSSTRSVSSSWQISVLHAPSRPFSLTPRTVSIQPWQTTSPHAGTAPQRSCSAHSSTPREWTCGHLVVSWPKWLLVSSNEQSYHPSHSLWTPPLGKW